MGLEQENIKSLYQRKYANSTKPLCKESITQFLIKALELLYPQLSQKQISNEKSFLQAVAELQEQLVQILICIQQHQQKLDGKSSNKSIESIESEAQKLSIKFIQQLDPLEQQITQDAQFVASEDPACQSINEVILCYPGFYAIAVYRLAHFFYGHQVPLLPRMMSEFAHEKTGIDIHPGARILCPFFIDHGTGIVIGETTQIGHHCKIFQGVTLGALSVKRKYKNAKRHPTIGNYCLIYSNTTILGGETIIGDHTTIGGNVWLTESIPAHAQVYRKHGFEVEIKIHNSK